MALIGCARGIFSYRIAFPFCYGYSRYMREDYAKHVKPEGREDEIAVARERAADQRKVRLRLEALQSGEVLPECEHCGSDFVGRSDARFCSTQCRVAAHRARKKAEGQETAAEKQAKEDARLQGHLLDMLEKYREDTKFIGLLARMGKLTPQTRKKILIWLKYAIEDIENAE